MKIAIFLLILTGLISQGCISVKLGSGSPDKSKTVRAFAPAKPFKEWNSSVADEGWQSQSTGNTIAYLSECRPQQSLPELSVLEREAMTPLQDAETIKREETTYNDRAALVSEYKGTVDGVPVKLSLVVFNKNGCSYTLSFGGGAQVFPLEVEYFKRFVDSFRAD